MVREVVLHGGSVVVGVRGADTNDRYAIVLVDDMQVVVLTDRTIGSGPEVVLEDPSM